MLQQPFTAPKTFTILRNDCTMTSLSFSPEKPWLAPLAGWSDLAFRLLCRDYGAAVCVTEMVSAKGLVYERGGKTSATRGLLSTTPQDSPLVVQLFGDDPHCMAAAVRLLRAEGFAFFDCNMGCSVPKVTRTGAGAALMQNPAQALDVAKAMIAEAEPGHVGFKLRLGWENTSETWQEIALGLARAGAGWLSLHPRYARQGFTGKADWTALARLKKLVDLPLVASGDLHSAQDGFRCIQESGADTVMYARGALSEPGIFARHRKLFGLKTGFLPAPDTAESLKACIVRHAGYIHQYADTRQGLLKMRTAVPRYVHGLPGIRQLRQDIILSKHWDECLGHIEHFFAHLPDNPNLLALRTAEAEEQA